MRKNEEKSPPCRMAKSVLAVAAREGIFLRLLSFSPLAVKRAVFGVYSGESVCDLLLALLASYAWLFVLKRLHV